ncbi:hypothetical protein BpHYR1_044527 [Brachionus plicatilis]|uniref:Uncharacterized protein n=1 Tax=Brachionus plicatilis TaxID=10195 RepID=A0A3M7SZ04_BRAPC|nr:hypothetical protein BpHYR1_044527 [Brachionus plicatilis]
MHGLINRVGLTWERWYGMHALKINFGFNCMQYRARVYASCLLLNTLYNDNEFILNAFKFIKSKGYY